MSENVGTGADRQGKAIQLTAEITPSGGTSEELFASLVVRLKRQNSELKLILNDLYRRLNALESKLNS